LFQVKPWKEKEKLEEERYVEAKVRPMLDVHMHGLFTPAFAFKEKAQLEAIAREIKKKESEKAQPENFEGGFGGQEELEDRYATTSGEH
jgi:hypothetical protein